MTALANKLVHFPTQDNKEPIQDSKEQELKYAKKKITNFLNDKSENTAKNYKIDINQFTQYFFKKDWEYVLESELEQIEADDVIEYRNTLKENYGNSTINRRMNSMKSLYAYLEATNPNIRKAIFNVAKALMENPKSWGTLSWEEVTEMIDRAKQMPQGKEFALLIEVATKTCIRLSALLNLTWSNIYDKVQQGDKIKVIETIDKGQPHLKPISDDVYERLTVLKKNDKKDEKLFQNFHPHKVADYLLELCKQMDIDETRNISFHSFKKAGINYVFDTTNDIMLAQAQGNHKSSATTMKSYLQHKTDLRDIPSYTMGETISLEVLETLTKEELLQAIMQMKSSSKLELLRIIQG